MFDKRRKSMFSAYFSFVLKSVSRFYALDFANFEKYLREYILVDENLFEICEFFFSFFLFGWSIGEAG